jgi:hypothetical protein
MFQISFMNYRLGGTTNLGLLKEPLVETALETWTMPKHPQWMQHVRK